MKSRIRELENYLILTVLLITSATFVACSSDDSFIEEPQQPAGAQTYTMTIQASKGGDGTRALSLDGKTLSATWAAGEKVTVYNVTKSANLEGYLEAQSSGASTTLKGKFTGTIANGDNLKLKFLSPSYGTQDGTLTGTATSIDKVCDYAEATVTVSAVSGSSITTSNATFTNQQAIVKFTLKKKADNSDLEIPAATALTVNDGTYDYTVTPASATNVLFVAIPATSTVNLSTTVGGISYSYEKTGAGLIAGKYYEITVKMVRGTVDLASITGNTTLLDGDIVTGTLGSNYKISVADGATVTLDNVVIQPIGYLEYDQRWAGITCLGDATIILKDGTTNTVKCFGHEETPGIFVPENKTLTIQGNTGSLSARGESGAAIGSGNNYSGTYASCGNIVINGGAINVQSEYGAGIGSGDDGSCGNIVINGGTITTSNHMGAGIGCGNSGSCGSINITGGTITTGSSESGAGIGSCGSGSCGNITISGGTVNASSMYGAGIGCSDNSSGSCGTITISGGTVNAHSSYGAGIGSGNNCPCSNSITINGGSVNAQSEWGAGIGGGDYSDCGNITITSDVTQVTARTGYEGYNSIGKGNSSKACGTVTIGGTVYYDGSSYQNGGEAYLATKPIVYSAHYFSVSSTKQVIFALGNLQATYYNSSFSYWNWSIATHQWDYIGNAAGNTSINGNGTASTNNVTVDLFCWVGNSSTLTSYARYGITNYNTNSTSYFGSSASESLKSDWGNTIGSGWRTLSKDEWNYVFNTRNASTVNSTANARYAKATVVGVAGVILFPDSYTHPGDVTAPASINTASAAFNVNNYDAAEWTKMEAAGCIFLPAAGYRVGTTVSDVGSVGAYWSSSSSTTNDAYRLFFTTSNLKPNPDSNSDISRFYGQSVRLVRDVN